jgi:HEAT repeat protein
MKRPATLFAVSLFFLFSQLLFSQEIANLNIPAKEACIKTLFEGMNSENEGLQAGCAYMFGELCCDKAVVSLLKILHNNPKEEMRILAALSLYKIGDSRGIFAIKQAVKFDESERVSRLCEGFYKAYLGNKTEEQVDVALN